MKPTAANRTSRVMTSLASSLQPEEAERVGHGCRDDFRRLHAGEGGDDLRDDGQNARLHAGGKQCRDARVAPVPLRRWPLVRRGDDHEGRVGLEKDTGEREVLLRDQAAQAVRLSVLMHVA